MARPWIKLHAHMLSHPGIGRLSDASYRAWITMLLMASQAEEPGAVGTLDDVAWMLHRSPDDVRGFVAELNGRVRLDGDRLTVRDWEEWQPPTTSTERVQRHRAAQRNGAASADETLPERGRSVSKRRDIEVEEDTETDSTPQSDDCDRWADLERAASDAYGGKRTRHKTTDQRLAWVGNIIRVGGRATGNDPPRAVSLWRKWWRSVDPQYRPTPAAAADKWGAWLATESAPTKPAIRSAFAGSDDG